MGTFFFFIKSRKNGNSQILYAKSDMGGGGEGVGRNLHVFSSLEVEKCFFFSNPKEKYG